MEDPTATGIDQRVVTATSGMFRILGSLATFEISHECLRAFATWLCVSAVGASCDSLPLAGISAVGGWVRHPPMMPAVRVDSPPHTSAARPTT